MGEFTNQFIHSQVGEVNCNYINVQYSVEIEKLCSILCTIYVIDGNMISYLSLVWIIYGVYYLTAAAYIFSYEDLRELHFLNANGLHHLSK